MKVTKKTRIIVEDNTAKYKVTFDSRDELRIYDKIKQETIWYAYAGPAEILELGQKICQVAETMKQEQKGE